MALTIILIVAIAVQIVGLIVLGYTCLALNEKIGDLKTDQEFYAELAKSNQKYYELISKQDIARAKVYDMYIELGEKIYEQYEAIHNDYEQIVEQHKTLLETWEKVEERYSDAYEEFKTYNAQFDRMTVNQIRNYELLMRQSEQITNISANQIEQRVTLEEMSKTLEDTLVIPPLWKEDPSPDQYDIFNDEDGGKTDDTKMENEAV